MDFVWIWLKPLSAKPCDVMWQETEASNRLKIEKGGIKIMAFIDYYKILGVDKSIPQKDIRKAYIKRTKQFHPDLHPDDPKAKAKFQALNEA